MHVLCRWVIWADKGTTLCIDCHLHAPWHKQVVLTQCPSITMCLCFCVSAATSIRASLSVSCSLVNSQSRISRLSTKQCEDNFRNRCRWWVLSKDGKIHITGRSDVESLKNSFSFLCHLFWRAAWTFTVWRSSLMPCSPLCPSVSFLWMGLCLIGVSFLCSCDRLMGLQTKKVLPAERARVVREEGRWCHSRKRIEPPMQTESGYSKGKTNSI